MSAEPLPAGHRVTRTGRKRGGLFFPLLIIGIGVVLLLNNLGVTDWGVWEVVVRLWPLLLIVTGLDLALERNGLLTPLLLCALGVAALLSTLGIWQWDMVRLAARYWPVLVIAIGVDVFITKPASAGALIGVLPAVAGIAVLAWFLGGADWGGRVAESRSISQALPAASSAEVRLAPIGGSLRVSALREGGLLVAGSIGLARGERLEESLSTTGGVATYTLTSKGSVSQPSYGPSDGRDWYWDLGVAPDLPVDLSVGMVAGSTHLDLSGLQVAHFASDTVFGKSYVLLPGSGTLTGDVEVVAGKVVIVVPASMAIRLTTDGLIGNVDVPDDFRRAADGYYSPGYDSASSRADITIDQLVGRIEVRYEKG